MLGTQKLTVGKGAHTKGGFHKVLRKGTKSLKTEAQRLSSKLSKKNKVKEMGSFVTDTDSVCQIKRNEHYTKGYGGSSSSERF